ncbi:hypothetical protein [Haliangium ochraceum]|uniref:hypothetical protein n=1 Tax=Haliangium ochraceum TaxID=80816 RepID=UPI00126A60AA|nr:hypothetical protein [Haliangium ochraceum]
MFAAFVSDRRPRARARTHLRGLALALGLVLLALGGCVEVGGGAAEFSWTLRNFAGDRALSCEGVGMSWVQLNWRTVAEGDPNPALEAEGSKRFPCADDRGITEFIIPSGRKMLWVEPLCQDGEAFTRYEVPPPVVRNVADGAVLTLDSLLIVVDPACTCAAECAAFELR